MIIIIFFVTFMLSIVWASIALGTIGSSLEENFSSPYTTKRRKIWSAFIGGPILWVMCGAFTLLTVARESEIWARFNAWLDTECQDEDKS